MEIKKGNNIDESEKLEASLIFVKAFYKWFKFFSKDIERLANVFKETFIWEYFYLAKEEDVLGMVSSSPNDIIPLNFKLNVLIKNLGLYKGILANFFLKKELMKRRYPFSILNSMIIENVVVKENKRGNGIAIELIKEALANDSKNFYLEVEKDNTSALKCYKKIGFKIIAFIESKRKNIPELIYMKY